MPQTAHSSKSPMPSRPLDSGWDFSQVLDLIDSDPQDIGSTTLLPRSQALGPSSGDISTDNPGEKHLGSFGKLWRELGVSGDVPMSATSPVEPESEEQTDEQTDSDNYFPPLADPDKFLPITDDHHNAGASCSFAADLTSFTTRKSVADPSAGMNKKQRSKARRRAEKDRRDNIVLELQYRQREKEKEDLQARLDLTLKLEPKRKQPIPEREQSRSNVGAKLRPATPTPKTVDFHKQAKELHKDNSILSYAPEGDKPFGLTPKPNHILKRPMAPAMDPKTLSPAPQSIPGPNPATTRAQYTTVGTPIRSQSQFPFPQSNGHGYTRPILSTSTSVRLVPRTVQPVIVPRIVQPPVTPQMFQPQMMPGTAQTPMVHYPVTLQSAPYLMTPRLPVTPGRQSKNLNIRPRVERHFQFLHQLMRGFPEDVPWLLSPMQLCNEKTATEGIHVFVDASNIMIGFRDTLREYQAQDYEMSFDSLVLLMERRRPVAKRVYAGSHRESAPLPHVTKLVETSKAIGYESNVKEQVLISREDSDRKKFFKAVKQFGWTKAAQLHSGSGDSDSEMEPVPTTPSAPKWVEQGVDELLHLKMCQSIIDTEVPSTMVLATGDGAEAEHSDGFLAHVERALKKGWKVELVSWKQQTNSGYKNKKFRTKWGEQFKIFHLDGYIESLIDTE